MAYTEAVVYAAPREVWGWEHEDSIEALVDIARADRWEELNVPSCEVVYFPNGITESLPDVHYAVVDGHHRHNAAKEAGKPFPVLPIDVGKDGRDRYAQMVLTYHGHGGYDADRNPYTSLDPRVPEWNADGIPTTHYLKETTEVHGPSSWSPGLRVKALRGPGVLVGTLDELLRDPALQLDQYTFDELKVGVGRKTYDHAKSSESTTFDYLTISYTGDKERPDGIDDLLANGQVSYSSLGEEGTYQLSDVRDNALSTILHKGRHDTVHEVELKFDADVA